MCAMRRRLSTGSPVGPELSLRTNRLDFKLQVASKMPDGARHTSSQTHRSFPSDEGWPFAKYLGACGRMVAVNYVGEELWSFYNAPWEKRVDLARQLMDIAEQLTNNDFEFALYLLDVSFDNFAVGPRDGKVIVVDAENVLVADKRLIKQSIPLPGFTSERRVTTQSGLLDSSLPVEIPIKWGTVVASSWKKRVEGGNEYYKATATCRTAGGNRRGNLARLHERGESNPLQLEHKLEKASSSVWRKSHQSKLRPIDLQIKCTESRAPFHPFIAGIHIDAVGLWRDKTHGTLKSRRAPVCLHSPVVRKEPFPIIEFMAF
ncbi:unnamed protein product [Pleuronectes platessa]|uniref:FAM69 protein-kinase domain-containing protein n=1 Tax=Pleuronectes platessa TaxID=8262 RepID=A0A9N7YBG3_PLEPL|nr:unnamed protein product [Pleuronectes platessa]